MQTKIQRWGNSLAIRIPKPIAEEVGLEQGGEVDLRVEEGGLSLRPVTPPEYDLETLVAQITDENRHDEVDFGDPVGKEVW